MKNIPVTSGKVEKRKTWILRMELATGACFVGYGGRLGWLRQLMKPAAARRKEK